MKLDRRLAIKTDHISILNFSLSTSTDILFNLGFVRGGGRTALDTKVLEMTAPTVRFVFDNAYIECVQFPPEINEFYNYLNTPAGIHIMALLTPDAEIFRQKLCRSGVIVDELEQVTRKNIDYGEKNGTVIFRLVPLPYEILPRTHIAFLEHRTRDLMYQPSRCAHLNGSTRLEEAIVCCPSESDANRIEQDLEKMGKLANNANCEGGMEYLRLMDLETVVQQYGVHPRENGSVFVGLRFGTPDLEETRKYIRCSGYPITEGPDWIQVHPPERLGLVFEFIKI